MEYGSVGMKKGLFNGKLAWQSTKEIAEVLRQTSKMLYVPQALLDTLGGFIFMIKRDGILL